MKDRSLTTSQVPRRVRELAVPEIPRSLYNRLDQIDKRVVDEWIKRGETTIIDGMPQKKCDDVPQRERKNR